MADEVLREVLSEHERKVLRMAGKGKSLAAIAGIYRQYEGENGVQQALDKIKEKVEARLAQRVETTTERSEFLEDMLGGREDDDDTGGIPIRSAPRRTMPDAGAGISPTRVEATPPRVPAPASSASTGPSPTPFNGNGGGPARAARVQRSAQSLSTRQKQVTDRLAVQRMSATRIAVELELPTATLRSCLMRLEERQVIERTTANAYDWPGAERGKGRPSRVWRLVDEPDGVLPALIVSGHSAPRTRAGEPVTPEGEGWWRCPCGKSNGVNVDVCADCGHARGIEDAPKAKPVSDLGENQTENRVPDHLAAVAAAASPERKGIVAGGCVREMSGMPGMGSVPAPEGFEVQLEKLPGNLAEYVEFLWSCAWKDPTASHIFDRIEKLTNVTER